ncbi:histidine phosphatase family protein [Heyndrickxia oleronia]|jgi:2,3-bisphosphoglycerate-dependent phosphoglycerate mutase|uniref:histidine phosphatase family protein n=1 Tax=Heyndrickxia oleronia TaxID=38875 RepID=UPI00242BB978|nr:histidine phosphatase family protein [Heyndrickxia oleronia]MCI1590540.1 histidine phosphatase family protein [Heyndrickxia oleronia]MCI1612578.1 histidine phosphatase family protein [Heyndrickxia oleronia]MCI1743806.1 histidine phosphatase family protein [Heyndrickxia oleronia]MCI1760517.1 histidine phosphatase family protein [Heyndrickxia oleronia]
MRTFIYMVRHGDSPKEGNERTRGLTEKGKLDAQRIAEVLKDEGINTVISSPYSRSILTVEPLAKQIGQEVLIIEDLKERIFTAENERISDSELFPLLEKSYVDPNFSLKGGETNAECQKRVVKVLKEILNTYIGKKVVICTHGLVMTLMMGDYDLSYDLTFLHNTSKPDIYRMEFNGQELVKVNRLWESHRFK